MIGGGGQIHLFAGFVFENKGEIHGLHPLYIFGLMMYNGNNRDVGSLRKIGIWRKEKCLHILELIQ